ncbi:GerAB/ArcD/ProY family transporter [Paenibacillus sp. IB182496]|uniref:GerAB/ArcD/ProY family transporter n=1 Tax=Paenibacillus sabuli TaxID=2772509 RepID=A0A927BY69_9BACL|nr:GerAB/ArcD/ProY family transporter [Paenibacillus sabuli]MBD2847584.1 GerAB/ArcD/ProY family transporter [Paenibacillus sabuli]
MKQTESVGSLQMAVLFLFFLTGSSIVIIPSPLTSVAGSGAWLSLLLALLLGMAMLAVLLYVHRAGGGRPFIAYTRSALGGPLTWFVMAPFALLLFWNVAGIVIEIGFFFKSTMLKETPTYAVNGMLFLIIALTVRAGLETMARMAALLLLLMFGFVALILVLVSGLYRIEFLLPILPEGIKPILHGAYIAYGFPYAELFIFAVLLPHVRAREAGRISRHLYIALAVNGLTFVCAILGSLMVLGPLTGELKYSLYQLARLIYIREIVERIELVIGFSLIVGFYFKTAIALLILIKLLAALLRLQDEQLLTFPVALICFLLSLTTYTTESATEQIVNVTWPLLTTLAYAAPVVLLAVVLGFKAMADTS